MSFASVSFAGLFLLVLVARCTLGSEKLGRSYFVVLLVASLVFYSWHIPQYLFLLLGISGLNYFVAGQLSAGPHGNRLARRWVALAVSGSLGTLAVFKYADFFLRGTGSVINKVSGADLVWGWEVALPIGISFYIFQSLSYVIDVYRGELKHRSSFAEFLLYVSFFPQLVAGPIVRAKDFFYQWPRRRQLCWPVVTEGCFQLIAGFFFKLVIADGLAALVDAYWGDRGAVHGIVGIGSLSLLFGGQIFADFAGYSMIARGLAYLLGFRLPLNFDAPYIAGSLQEFWRRWHISLSTWLRDYLYVPLGGNRHGRSRTMRNVFLVMLLGGLWHGAGVPFILWGAIHGLGLLMEKGLGVGGARPWKSFSQRIGWDVLTQCFVFLAWMVFRMESAGELVTMMGSALYGGIGLGALSVLALGGLYLMPICGLHVRRILEIEGLIGAPQSPEKAVWAGVMLVAILSSYAQGSAFIYFQF